MVLASAVNSIRMWQIAANNPDLCCHSNNGTLLIVLCVHMSAICWRNPSLERDAQLALKGFHPNQGISRPARDNGATVTGKGRLA